MKLLLLMLSLSSFAATVSNAPSSTPGYSPVGKRDPFKPPVILASRELASSSNPIERYNADKFLLKAILHESSKARAMLQSPDGKTFIISEGETIGRDRAVVSRILNTELLLTERTFNYLGKETLYERVLSLPNEDNVNDATGGEPGGNYAREMAANSAAPMSAPSSAPPSRPSAPPTAAPSGGGGSGPAAPFIGPNVR
jgi:Tfp pilus assembly protein PilP